MIRTMQLDGVTYYLVHEHNKATECARIFNTFDAWHRQLFRQEIGGCECEQNEQLVRVQKFVEDIKDLVENLAEGKP